jgi:portal protein
VDENKREFLALKESDIFEEARDRLKIATDAESDNRTLAKEDLLFAEGEGHWDQEGVTSASMETPELVINLTDARVRRVVNNMKQQRPRGKAHPVGEGADVDTAKVINGIGRHIEYRSEASVAYDLAGDMAVRAGWGYARLVVEYLAPNSFQKDLRILPIDNIFSVFMDPSAVMPTACDANWCLVTVLMARTEYKRRYPRADNVSWSDNSRDYAQDWEDKEELRLAEYFRIREKSEKLYLIRSVNGEYARFQTELPKSLPAGDVIIHERESARRSIEWFQLNGTKVIQREILPGTWIPVVRCAGNAINIDGKISRRGMVRAMKDPQRMVDYGEVAKIKRLGLAPQAPWVVAEGQIEGHPEWSNTNREPIPVLTYKPVTVQTEQGEVVLPPPQRQPPAQIEAGFSEFVQGMRANLNDVSGMPNEPGQDMQGQVVSGRAIDKRQRLSDQSHFQYYDNQTLMIAHLWRIILEYIPVTYHEKGRIQRIIGEDGMPSMETLNEKTEEAGVTKLKNDITVGRYDVVMDTGPGYDTKREEGAQNLIDLLGVAPLAEIIAKVGADLVFRSLDHPYMQELADRLSAQTPEGLQKIMAELPERARNIVQSLASENAQLKQALQQAQMGITKEHIAATVKAHDVEESNKTKRIDTLVRAETALKVEEIRAAGKILDTHAQAGHDQRAQERMIEAGETAEQGSTNGST